MADHLEPVAPSSPKAYRKAILSGVIAGLGALSAAFTDGAVTPSEIVAVSLATAIAVGGVYGISNAPTR